MKRDYFYGEQLEQFKFIKIPKVLWEEDELRKLSSDAKLLYALLLDRTCLSQKKGWIDTEGRVYVIYTIENIKYSLNCADRKVTRILKLLEKYDLIERIKRGQGKPDIIYVKKIVYQSKQRFKTSQNNHSEPFKITIQEASKQQCNNTKFNNINISDNNLISSRENDIDEKETCKQYFIHKLEYRVLKRQYPNWSLELDEILDLLVETVCSKSKKITIASDKKDNEVVKCQLMKLEYCHIQYVLDCLEKQSTEIRNIKQYLLATLYNAPFTINNYYTAMYNNDKANGRI